MERIDSAELSRFLSPDDIEAVYGGDISICGCVHKIKNLLCSEQADTFIRLYIQAAARVILPRSARASMCG